MNGERGGDVQFEVGGRKVHAGALVLGMFFVEVKDVSNWMAFAWRDHPGGDVQVVYRFRHFRDTKAFGSDDERNWYEGTMPASTTNEEAIEKLRGMRDLVSTGAKTLFFQGVDQIVDDLVGPIDVEEFMDLMANSGKSWLQAKTLKPGETVESLRD